MLGSLVQCQIIRVVNEALCVYCMVRRNCYNKGWKSCLYQIKVLTHYSVEADVKIQDLNISPDTGTLVCSGISYKLPIMDCFVICTLLRKPLEINK